jgi:hypothetical protein
MRSIPVVHWLRYASLEVDFHLEGLKDVRIKRVGDWLPRLSRFEQQEMGFGQFRQPVIGPRRPQALRDLVGQPHEHSKTRRRGRVPS